MFYSFAPRGRGSTAPELGRWRPPSPQKARQQRTAHAHSLTTATNFKLDYNFFLQNLVWVILDFFFFKSAS